MTIVNFYNKGTENVKLSTLKKLAGFFSVSLDYIADDNITNKVSTQCEDLNNISEDDKLIIQN